MDLHVKNFRREHKLNSLQGINFISCSYLILWTLIPLFRSMTNQGVFRIVFVGIAIVWLLTSFMMSRKWIIQLSLVSFFASIYIMVMLLYTIFGYGNTKLIILINPLFLLLYSYMGFFYVNYGNQNIIKKIMIISGICFIVTSLTSVYNLADNINASRLLTSSSTSPEITKYLENKNIAAFDFIYGAIIVIPPLVASFKKLFLFNKNSFRQIGWRSRATLLIALVSAVLLISFSNFTTAYILLIVALAFSFIPVRKKIYKTIFIAAFLGIILSPLIYLSLVFIFEFIKNTSPSIRMQIRMSEIINILNGSSSLDSLTGRKELLENSLNSFTSSPLFGVGAYYGGENEFIGSHAQFVDDLGRYGFIGALPIFTYMYYVLKKIYKNLQDKHVKAAYFYSCIIFILLGFLNPIQSYGIMFFVFFMLPIFSKYLDSYFYVLIE